MVAQEGVLYLRMINGSVKAVRPDGTAFHAGNIMHFVDGKPPSRAQCVNENVGLPLDAKGGSRVQTTCKLGAREGPPTWNVELREHFDSLYRGEVHVYDKSSDYWLFRISATGIHPWRGVYHTELDHVNGEPLLAA